MLPTNHGFDEFFGNLYHLNAEEEPEMPDYPPEKDFPNFRKKIGPRGVIHSWATDKDDPDRRSRAGARSASRGSRTPARWTRKRMETCDDEFVMAAKDFIQRARSGRKAVLRVAEHHPHALLHAYQEEEPGPGRALASRLITTP